jgi:hypothetical protein
LIDRWYFEIRPTLKPERVPKEVVHMEKVAKAPSLPSAMEEFYDDS